MGVGPRQDHMHSGGTAEAQQAPAAGNDAGGATPTASVPPPPPPPPRPSDNAGSKEGGDGAARPRGFQRKFVPGLPPMEIEYDNMYMTKAELPSLGTGIAAGPAGGGGAAALCDTFGDRRYLRYPDAQPRGTWTVRASGTRFPYQDFCRDGAYPPSYMNVCVFGGDAALHRVLCNYVVMRQEEVLALTADDDDAALDAALLKTRIFLVPTARGATAAIGGQLSDLSAFIARHDVWYRRQVFSQFTGSGPGAAPVLVLPQLRQEPDYRWVAGRPICCPCCGAATQMRDFLRPWVGFLRSLGCGAPCICLVCRLDSVSLERGFSNHLFCYSLLALWCPIFSVAYGLPGIPA